MLITLALLTPLACPPRPQTSPSVSPTRPVHGQVLQEGTGLPLADLTLELRGVPGRRSQDPEGPKPTVAQASVTTDADGLFVTEQAFPEGRLRVTVRGTEVRVTATRGTVVTFDNDHDAGRPLTIWLDVPRKLELAVHPPVGYSLDDLRARPLPPDRHHTTLSTWAKGVRLREADDGGRPWLRRTQPSWRPAQALESEGLFVYTEDGYWGGRTHPLSASGPDAAAQQVRLEPYGALELTLNRPGAAGTPGRAGIVIPSGRPNQTVRTTLTHPAGLTFEVSLSPGVRRVVKWLPPGSWTVTSDDHWYSATRAEAEVVHGRTTRLELAPTAARPTGTLTLRVEEAEGDIPDWSRLSEAPNVSATVRDVEAGQRYSVETWALCGNGIDAWFQRVERDGHMVLEATLGPVVVDDYEVDLRVDGRAFEGPEVVRPDEVAVFVLHAAQLGFRVRSARTGEPLGGYRVINLRSGAASRALSEQPLEVLAPGVSLHAVGAHAEDVSDWCLVAPGHRRAYGGRRDFRQTPGGGWAEVELEPGWGLRLVARAAEGGWAKSVGISLGGHGVTTDNGGRALLTADAAPTKPRLHFDGWRVVSGDVARNGSFDPEANELRVTLERIR